MLITRKIYQPVISSILTNLLKIQAYKQPFQFKNTTLRNKFQFSQRKFNNLEQRFTQKNNVNHSKVDKNNYSQQNKKKNQWNKSNESNQSPKNIKFDQNNKQKHLNSKKQNNKKVSKNSKPTNQRKNQNEKHRNEQFQNEFIQNQQMQSQFQFMNSQQRLKHQQFNQQLNEFITKFIKGLLHQQNSQLKIGQIQKQNDINLSNNPFLQNQITWSSLSNLYRFIQMKLQFHQISYLILDWKNKNQILQLLKCKNKQKIVFNNWSVGKHLEICQTMYLISILNLNNKFPIIQSQFLQYLNDFPSFVKQSEKNKQIEFIFQKSEQIKQKFSDKLIFFIDIDKMFTTSWFTNNFVFQIIKTISQSTNRSKNQFFMTLRALCKLLSIKQLKTLDKHLNEKYLIPTFNLLQSNQSIGQNNLLKNDKNILSISQVAKICSILSQLNIQASYLYSVQKIFCNLMQKQIISHQKIIQLIKSKKQQPNDHQLKQHLENQKITLQFDALLQTYIAIAEIKSMNKQFETLFQKLFLYKFMMQKIITQNKNTLDSQLREKVENTYKLNNKKYYALISTFHKFKKGNHTFLVQNNDKLINANMLVCNQNANKKNTYQIKNFWIQVQNKVTRQKSLPQQQFVFPILSGIYRSYSDIVKTTKISNLSNQIDAKINLLFIKLYSLDKQLQYISQLPFQKLIEFILITNFSIQISLNLNLKQIIQNKNKTQSLQNNNYLLQKIYKNKIQQIQNVFMPFINKVLSQLKLKNAKQKQQKINKKEQLILNVLKFYYLHTELQTLFYSSIYLVQSIKIESSQSEINKLNKKYQQNSQKIKLILDQIKNYLKKIPLNNQNTIVISLLIENQKQFLQHLQAFNNETNKNSDKANLKSKESVDQKQLFSNFIKIYDNLQSYIGFAPSQQIKQYKFQLFNNNQANQNDISQQQQIDDSQNLQKNKPQVNKIKNLQKTQQNSNSAPFQHRVSDYIHRNNIILQQLLRIIIIQNQQTYQLFNSNQIFQSFN